MSNRAKIKYDLDKIIDEGALGNLRDRVIDYIETEIEKAKKETLEKVWSYTYNGLFLNEALDKIKSEVENNE